MRNHRTSRYDVRRIKPARLKRGLTQAELARRIDKDPSTISKIEMGVFLPLPPTMLKIAKELNLDMDEIILEKATK